MITSPANPRLKLVRRLRGRRQRQRLGLFVVEGEDLVEAAVGAGIEPVDVLVAGEDVEPELLAGVSELGHAPRIIAVFRAADLPPFSSRATTLALWRVRDPGNLGTLLRSADAFGAALCLSAGCADPTGSKALRASMGAVFRVPAGRFDEAPKPRIALVPRGGRPLEESDLATPATFVLGGEREGLPEDVLSDCAETLTIPLEQDTESLNVAMAGTIALYEWRRQNVAR